MPPSTPPVAGSPFIFLTRPLPTVALLALVLAAGLPGTLPAQADEGAEPYAVQPGDQLQLRVFTAAGTPLAEVAGERIVGRDGRIFLPFLGTVHVAGRSAVEIRELLVRSFSEFYDQPVVDVRARLRVNVTGAVRAPGHYFLDPSTTIVDALASAGGTGSEVALSGGVAADASQVRVVRGDRHIVLNLQADQATEEAVDFQIRSGDWIYVPPRARSRLRDNISFAASIISLIGGTVGLIFLLN